jgi:KDO2-lipid IV(A) lauroyltransferase
MKGAILKWLAAAFTLLFGRLSPGTAAKVGIVLGDIAYFVDRRHRSVACKNLRLAFGDALSKSQIREITRAVFRNMGQTVVEFLQIPALSPEKAMAIISPEHRERLDECLKSGKGVVLVASHFGNWELMAAAGAMVGYPISAVARPLDDPDLERIVRKIRESSGLKVIERRSAYRVVKRLKQNEIVGILADQNTRRGNVFVEFFGMKAATTAGPAMLALRTGAALVPVFMLREGPGKHRLIIERPIEVTRTDDMEADALAITQKCANTLEDYIRRYPSQWFWVHRRWRTRPHR